MGMCAYIGLRHRVRGPEGLPIIKNQIEIPLKKGNLIMY